MPWTLSDKEKSVFIRLYTFCCIHFTTKDKIVQWKIIKTAYRLSSKWIMFNTPKVLIQEIHAKMLRATAHSWGIRTVINLQMPGEHASCGPPLTKSGFTYDPSLFMANDIYYYNFAWPDFGEASLSGLLDMAKVLSFALQEGRVAIHCHAGFLKLILYLVLLFICFIIGLKLWLEPIKGVCKCKTKLQGKVALITGGNSGIGLETARDLAKRGARVIIACRNTTKSKEAIADIIKSTGNTNVEYRHLDLSKFSSIRKFADDFNETIDRLDILVNNAGCAGVKQKPSEDGIDLVMQINYLGPFLLTNLLLDKLKASKPSRIVIVSSYAHILAKFDPEDLVGLNSKGTMTKYSNSKLCNVLWTKALSKRLPERVTVNALHPGVVKTNIFSKLSPWLKTVIYAVINMVFKSPEEGAQTTIHLSVAPEIQNSTGGYYANCKLSNTSDLVKNDYLVEKVYKKSLYLTGAVEK